MFSIQLVTCCFFTDSIAILFIEAYISCTNCVWCPTLWSKQCCIIAGLLLCLCILIFLLFKFLQPVYKECKIISAHVQQVWIWWETESHFCRRTFWASIIKCKSILKGSYHSKVDILFSSFSQILSIIRSRLLFSSFW